MAINAPVLPAETTPPASPAATASMDLRMLEFRPVRNAADGFAALVTTSKVSRISVTEPTLR
jgi:hypothetical protein